MQTPIVDEKASTRALCKFHIVSPNKLAFSLHILDPNLLEQIQIKDDNKHILIFALDTSGSMSGSALNNAKRGITELLSNASMFDDFQDIVLLSYHETVNYVNTLTKETYISEISKQKCGGSTNFVAALNTIEQLIETKTKNVPKAQIQVCFLTDGCHNMGGDAYQTIAILKERCHSNNYSHLSIGFHCIGFTSSHDVKMLQSIIAIGNAQGSFQYAAGNSELDICITQLQNVFDATRNANQQKGITVHMRNRTKKIKLKSLEYFESTTPLQLETVYSVLNSFLWRVPLENNKEVLLNELGLEIVPMDTVAEELEIELLEVQDKLSQLTRKLDSNKDITVEELATLDDQLTRMVNEDKRFKGSKLKKVEKSQIFDQIKELKDRIAKLYTIQKTKTKQKNLSTHELATLLASTYDFITKKHLQKKLDKRVMENMELLNKADETKTAILSKCESTLDESKVSSQSLEDYKCIISARNWVECILDKTALGFGIEMSRSQAAIADPAQIQINNISPCVVAIESFMNTAQYRLDSLEFDELKLHGGFQGRKSGQSGSVVEGLGRENINGLIPLYIDKQHWLMAKQEAKGLFGWMTTCDMFGFESKQLYTIPLVALASFLKLEKWSEVHAQLFLQLWRTCRALTVETPDYAKNFKMEDYSKYENRTSDKVSSHMLLLGKILTDTSLVKEWNMEMNELVLAIIEEDVRRNCRQLEDSYEATLIKLMQCEKLVQMKKDVKPSQLWEVFDEEKSKCTTQEEGDALMDKEIVYESVCADQQIETESMNSELKTTLSTKFLKTLLKFVVLMENFFDKYHVEQLVRKLDEQHGVADKELITELQTIFNDSTTETSTATLWIDDFLSITKSKSTTKYLNKKMVQALVVQNFAHRSNATRRDSAANSTIYNPFTQSDVILDQFVTKCRRTQIGRILNKCQQDYNFENRFKRFTVAKFLQAFKDSIPPVYYSWLEKHQECFKDATFYDVKTQFNHSVAARRDILKVDEEQALKEMIFLSKATNKPVLIAVTGTKKIVEAKVDNQYEQKHGRLLQLVFPDESDLSLKNGLTLNSVPLWTGLVEQDSMVTVWDKSLISSECAGVYGASGVPHILCYLPRSTLDALFQLKEKKDWNLFNVARF